VTRAPTEASAIALGPGASRPFSPLTVFTLRSPSAFVSAAL